MERLQGYKFELMPNGEQQRQMRQFAGRRRFVFNRALALQKERYASGEKKLGYAALCKELTEWRNSIETPWLADAPIHPLQQSLKDLERAYRNFFEGRADSPRFKKKGQAESFRYPDPKQFSLEQGNSRIFLPKIGWLRYRNSREVEGELRNITVSLSGGKYFVSIQTRREVPLPVHPSTSVVGIDVGITRFATLSDGTVIEPLNSFRKHQDRLKRYQRRMARKVKFSNNWKKAKAKVARVATHVANARRDILHKASTTISQNHAVVIVEDLQVRNMSRSAKGTIEAPGSNVRAKSGLNRSILDQGWSAFRTMLEYKLPWAGGSLIAVPPHHTSQMCPECGHVSADNRRTQAHFACVECGYEENADLVGAINVLERGHRLSACGEMALLGHSMKQKPSEAAQVAYA
jgi:putative transposase